MDYRRCPECDCRHTEMADQQQERDQIIQIRICPECSSEYVAKYDLYAKNTTQMP